MAKTIKVTVPLWDEGGHTVLDYVTVSGQEDQIKKLEKLLESVQFLAHRGEPREQSVTEFFRRHHVSQ
jgi:hypothetical protein